MVRLNEEHARKFTHLLCKRYSEKLLFEIFDPEVEFSIEEVKEEEEKR